MRVQTIVKPQSHALAPGSTRHGHRPHAGRAHTRHAICRRTTFPVPIHVPGMEWALHGRQTRFVCQRWIRIYRTDALAFRCMAGDHGHHAETIENGELKIENENSVRNSKISDTFQAVGCFEGKLKLKLYVTL